MTLAELSDALAAASAVSNSLGAYANVRDPAKLDRFANLLAADSAKPGFNVDALDAEGHTLLQKVRLSG